jgi:Na+/melibiose symporter-like transporter
VVLGFGVMLFEFLDNPSVQFLLVALIAQAIGTATSVFFICVIREKELCKELPPSTPLLNEDELIEESLIDHDSEGHIVLPEERAVEAVEEKEEQPKNEGLLAWFKIPGFYLCCACYVGVRAFNNSFTVLLPFYLVAVLRMGDSADGISFNLALVPLIVYASATLTSSRLSKLYKLIGRKKALVMGTFLGLSGLLGMYFLTPEYSWLVYYYAAFVGVSSGLVLSTGINLISEVVGNKGSQGAFVYGVYSFMDKSIVGLLVFVVTHSPSYSKS